MTKRNIRVAVAFIIASAGVAIGFYFFQMPDQNTKRMTITNVAGEDALPKIEDLPRDQSEVPASDQLPTVAEKQLPIKPEEIKPAPAKPLAIIEDTTIQKTSDAPAVSSKLQITNKLVSWGFTKASKRTIDTIIVHSSYNALGGDNYDFNKLLSEYQDYGVAPHYLIDRKGNIYQLVADQNIAYHAGESKTPDGRTNVNNFSIGIEIMTTTDEQPTGSQYSALNSLIASLKTKYKIKYTLGHKDIAPGRKTDPWNFEWSKVKR